MDDETGSSKDNDKAGSSKENPIDLTEEDDAVGM